MTGTIVKERQTGEDKAVVRWCFCKSRKDSGGQRWPAALQEPGEACGGLCFTDPEGSSPADSRPPELREQARLTPAAQSVRFVTAALANQRGRSTYPSHALLTSAVVPPGPLIMLRCPSESRLLASWQVWSIRLGQTYAAAFAGPCPPRPRSGDTGGASLPSSKLLAPGQLCLYFLGRETQGESSGQPATHLPCTL